MSKRSKRKQKCNSQTIVCQKCKDDGYYFDHKLHRIRCSCVWKVIVSDRRWRKLARRAKKQKCR